MCRVFLFFLEMQAPPPPPQDVDDEDYTPDFTDFYFNPSPFPTNPPDRKLRINNKEAVKAAKAENVAGAPIPFTKENGMEPRRNADNSISFDLSKLFLLDSTAGEIRVWQVDPAEEDIEKSTPKCCQGEAYFNNNIFYGIFRRWKGSLFKKTYMDGLCEDWKKQLGEKDGQLTCDQEMARQKEASDMVDLNVAFAAANVGVNLYAMGTAGGMPRYNPVYNSTEKIPKLLRRLLKLSTKIQLGDQSAWENAYNIVRYVTELNFNAIDKKLPRFGKNKHFYACMMTKGKLMPLYWFAFTLRTVGDTTCMLLHGFVKSILQLVFQTMDNAHENHEFLLDGKFCLSMLLIVAACLNNYQHIPLVYMQALTGTEGVIRDMKNEEGSPFLQYTNLSANSADRRFVDFVAKSDDNSSSHTDLPDKLIVDLHVLKYWRRKEYLDEVKETADAVAKGLRKQEDQESAVKKAKINDMLAKYLVWGEGKGGGPSFPPPGRGGGKGGGGERE